MNKMFVELVAMSEIMNHFYLIISLRMHQMELSFVPFLWSRC